MNNYGDLQLSPNTFILTFYRDSIVFKKLDFYITMYLNLFGIV